MKIRLLLALAGFAIGFVSPTFAQDTIDPKIIEQVARRRIRILRRHTTNTMPPPSPRFSPTKRFW
jgi:hypothetical protein